MIEKLFLSDENSLVGYKCFHDLEIKSIFKKLFLKERKHGRFIWIEENWGS